MIEKYLIGTYTKKTSQGVYSVELDTTNKKLQNRQLVATAGNPTYVAESAAKKVYVIDKVTQGDKVSGGLKVVDAASGELPYKEINQVIDQKTSPAYVSVDEKRQLVYTAN